NVALPDLSLTQGGEMAAGHIIHMNEIKSCIDERRDAAFDRLQDDSTGWRGSYIARPDRRRRIDNDRGKAALRHQSFHQTFGGNLAALVRPDTFVLPQRS